MALSSSRGQGDVRRMAPHVGQETDQSDDRLELAQFEDAAARDKHLRVLAIHRHRVHDATRPGLKLSGKDVRVLAWAFQLLQPVRSLSALGHW